MYTLMIKTHNVTGLKYLCKTANDDIYGYLGSGKHWKRHLRKHGRDVHTDVIFQTENIDTFKTECLRYSDELNVVESKEWANLIPETGLDGGTTHNNPYWLVGFKHSEESRKKIGEGAKGRKTKGFLGKKHTEETKQKMRKPKGPQTLEHRKKNSEAHKGLKLNLTNEGRESHSKTMSGMLKKKYECSYCGKIGNAGQIARYHKNCMEMPGWNKKLKQ